MGNQASQSAPSRCSPRTICARLGGRHLGPRFALAMQERTTRRPHAWTSSGAGACGVRVDTLASVKSGRARCPRPRCPLGRWPAGRRRARSGDVACAPRCLPERDPGVARRSASWGASRRRAVGDGGRRPAIVGFKVVDIPGGGAYAGGAFGVRARDHRGGAGGGGPAADRRQPGGGVGRAGARAAVVSHVRP